MEQVIYPFSSSLLLTMKLRLDINGKTNYFAIDNYVNSELVKGYYQCAENLLKVFENCDTFNPRLQIHNFTLGDYERLKRTNKSISIKEKRKIIVEQLELLGNCQTEMEYQFKTWVCKLYGSS